LMPFSEMWETPGGAGLVEIRVSILEVTNWWYQIRPQTGVVKEMLNILAWNSEGRTGLKTNFDTHPDIDVNQGSKFMRWGKIDE
jgi:hypothetical protein